MKQKVKDTVLKKIVSRCWKWALRKNGKSYFSKEFRIYLKCKFGKKYSPKFVRYFVYQTWRKEEKIRKLNFTPKNLCSIMMLKQLLTTRVKLLNLVKICFMNIIVRYVMSPKKYLIWGHKSYLVEWIFF